MFKNFESFDISNAGVRLSGRIGGQLNGKPLLLIHGHPQSHAMWHLTAPELARHFRVVMFDLRGYGDSDRPATDAVHTPYSKRAMATDAMAVMAHFGYSQFQVLAHDRGARVAHRLAADFPAAVERMMLLDIAPTLAMYENTTQLFATLYWHWFFLIQPAPLPEALIGDDPVRYIHSVMGSRYGGLEKFAPAALREYERCAFIPNSAMAMAEDYRAAATIDLEHDRADVAAGKKIDTPIHVLWGAKGVVAQCFDVLTLWRERANHVSGLPVESGHYIPEENPTVVLQEALAFFTP
ncbi:MAG: alpha/beta hydrolase [Cytophagales bacterium]|nr:alpha/beta hydrolase [Cytophagales bacterium]